MEKTEQARKYFLSAYNCAQSVLLAYASELHYSTELAQKIAAGFGGGMGKTQQTCGAVTGAIMVLGILRGEVAGDNEELKNESYRSVRTLMKDFHDRYGTTRCSELTGCDLNTPEGSARFREENMMENICAGCVEEAVRILESLKPGKA